jgi:sugar phosphate isomerase/epimerase
MTGVALSTMWAQQDRFAGNFTAFAAAARNAGYSGIEVSHSTRLDDLEALMAGDVLPVVSLHAPTPRMRARNGRDNGALNLASIDEDERAQAVEHTVRTLDFAARAGARYIVVHLGGIGARLLDGEARLRRLYPDSRIDSEEAVAARDATFVERSRLAPPYLEAARRSLGELVRAATERGVTIGLENRLHFHEIPSADETVALLAEVGPDQAGYWHDVGHAEVQSRLGLIDARGALASLTPRLIGAHLHDVRGITDHRAPGNGDVDWSYIAAALSPTTHRTLEIDQREPEPLLAGALAYLRARDVL